MWKKRRSFTSTICYTTRHWLRCWSVQCLCSMPPVGWLLCQLEINKNPINHNHHHNTTRNNYENNEDYDFVMLLFTILYIFIETSSHQLFVPQPLLLSISHIPMNVDGFKSEFKIWEWFPTRFEDLFIEHFTLYESMRFPFLLATIAYCFYTGKWTKKKKWTKNNTTGVTAKLHAIEIQCFWIYLFPFWVCLYGVGSLDSYSTNCVGIIHFWMNIEHCSVIRRNGIGCFALWALSSHCSKWMEAHANERIMVRFMESDLIRTGEDECVPVDNVMLESMPSDTFVRRSDLVGLPLHTDIQWKLIRWMLKVSDITYIHMSWNRVIFGRRCGARKKIRFERGGRVVFGVLSTHCFAKKS